MSNGDISDVPAEDKTFALDQPQGRPYRYFTEEITHAVIMAIGDSEGEPLGLRAATILAAIMRQLQ